MIRYFAFICVFAVFLFCSQTRFPRPNFSSEKLSIPLKTELKGAFITKSTKVSCDEILSQQKAVVQYKSMIDSPKDQADLVCLKVNFREISTLHGNQTRINCIFESVEVVSMENELSKEVSENWNENDEPADFYN